ncbi:penicillin acylase family protein [Lentzea sp. NPDC034063]|uniref:penicillin acylase family protein n=1 Tax=unclassified Lentzea TaxID=2643253 RepID=UPI0034018E36
MRRIAGSALVVVLLASGAGSATPSSAAGVGTGGALVIRDPWGVPHVVASDFTRLGDGIGQAFAADNACAMLEIEVTNRGERARWHGAGTAPAPDLLTGFRTNLESDLYHRSINDAGEVERLLALPVPQGPSAQARALVEGYVRGFNRYLRTASLPGECKDAPWVNPLTELDIWRHVHHFGMQGSAVLAPGVLNAQPPGSGQAPAPASSLLDRVTAVKEQAAAGSNAIAVGGDLTRDGSGVLLANPHFPWVGNGRFYRMRLTVPGRLNAAGSAPFGVPILGIGYNRQLAWTHTVSAATPMIVRKLTLQEGDPTTYLVDGKPRKMMSQVIDVPVRRADGVVSPVRKTLYRTDFGRIVELDANHRWTASTAYAVDDANEGNLRQIDTFLAESQADDVEELERAHARWQGVPFFTTTAADSRGRVYFDSVSVVPNLTDGRARQCIAAADQPIFQASGLAIIDGATSACALGNDSDAVQPGTFGPRALPRMTRTDWVANSNDSAWLTNPTTPQRTPRIVGDSGTERNLRTRFGAVEIQRLASTASGVTRDDLLSLVLDNRVYSAELTMPDVLAMCARHEHALAKACEVLTKWDRRADTNSRGAVLWQVFWQRLRAVPGRGWAKPFDAAAPLTTPAGLRADDSGVRDALTKAAGDLESMGLPLDVSVGAVQHTTGSPVSIPIHGCSGTAGCYNAVYTGAAFGLGASPEVLLGTSHLFAARMSRSGADVKTVLAYSQSTDPASPHHSDQTELFAAKKLIGERLFN